jgi:hypothetical protein
MERRTSASVGCPEWEVEAKRRLVMWRQQLSMAKALVHGVVVVEVAAQKGVRINGSGLRECMESSSFQDILLEAARKLRNISRVQSRVVYSCTFGWWGNHEGLKLKLIYLIAHNYYNMQFNILLYRAKN